MGGVNHITFIPTVEQGSPVTFPDIECEGLAGLAEALV
jgi:hypothetical protein